MEIMLIKKFNTIDDRYGYNIVAGGTGNLNPAIECWQYDLDGNFVKKWDDIHDLSTELNLDYSEIMLVCKGKKHKVKGHIFRFEKDDNVKPRHTVNREYPIVQFDLTGGFVKRWNCIRDAAVELGLHSTKIKEACNFKRSQAYGYYWLYEKDYNDHPEWAHWKAIAYLESTEFQMQFREAWQYSLDGELIKKHKNFNVLEEECGIQKHDVINAYYCSQGKYKSIKGYKWECHFSETPFDELWEEQKAGELYGKENKR